jgi:hypothetical protein
MRRWLVGLAVGSVALGVGWGVGCKSSTEDAPDPTLVDVVYEGGTTDEALVAMLAAPLKDEPAEAAIFTWPTSDTVVPPEPPPEFCWSWGTTALNAPSRKPPSAVEHRVGFDREPGHWGTSPDAPEQKGTLASAGDALLKELLAGVPSAYAHGTPLSGTGYFVVFSTSKDPKLIRVFTTSHDYTPDAPAMKKLTSAGETIHAIVTTAEFDQNRIAQDGGPYKGIEVTFTMAPM